MTTIKKHPDLFADLEANGLLGQDPWDPAADTIWMFAGWDQQNAHFKLWLRDDLITDEVTQYCDSYKEGKVALFKLSKLKKYLKKNKPLLAMHNGIKYDSVVLRNILDIDVKLKYMVDTLILSKLSDPDRWPGHGLAAWGQRFGVEKPEHEDWNNFSLDMIHRCLRDCKITYRTWCALEKELTDPTEALLGVKWDEAIVLEHEVAAIAAECEALGFPFNRKRGKKAYKRMRKHRDKLDKEIGFHNYLLAGKRGSGVTAKKFMETFAPICDLNPKEWSHFLEDKVEVDPVLDPEPLRGYGVPIHNIFTKGGKYQSRIIHWWADHPVTEATRPYSCIETRKEYPKDYLDQIPDIVGPYTCVVYEPVSPTSNTQMIKLLLSLGWEPDEWTDTGNPKITESSVERFAEDNPDFINLKDRIITQARMTMMKNEKDPQKGLLNLILDNGTIPSINDSIGTNTHRSKHKKVVNTPGNDARWGQLFRKCFHSLPWDGPEWFTYSKPLFDKSGYKITHLELNKETGKEEEVQTYKEKVVKGFMALIGCDAQALEARLLGAFMGDKAFIDIVLNGDIHEVFWDTVREFFTTRGKLKNAEYAFIFGGGGLKIGGMVNSGRDTVTESTARRKGWKKLTDGRWTDNYREKYDKEPLTWKQVQDTILGNIIIDRFLEGLPALKKLVDDLKAFAKKHKLIKGLDGRRFKVRKAHAVLNLKIQSAGAIVMKRALVMAYKRFKKAGIPWYLHCYYHDEFNISVPPPFIKEACHILEQSIRDAGAYYKLKCPMDAKAKVGLTWSDVH